MGPHFLLKTDLRKAA